ncbi:hypothetical protein GOBAR_AA38503 [Gossypium barbadense]|uniref:RING-type E3 ubiquitin transferase n=1 Tax=Gossypium barbadense TaxID=3634 RepID=A0A2P5VTR4_GOSBA|nr:hypothetical protein GOBAR_AA38503 [Gossypium barbadense]
MEEDSERNSQDVPLPGTPGHMEGGGLVGDHSGLPALCTLCRRSLAPEYEAMPDLETVGLCGDCKFLLLEDLDTPPQVYNRRRQARRRRNRQSSSESIENLFSQQFSHMITLLRQNQSTVSGSEDQIMDGGSSARSLRRSSSRTTPSSSRRWRRVISDSDSDGFDNLDSFYEEDDEGDEDGEWEEADAEEYVVGHTMSRTGLLNLFTSSPHESNLPAFNFRRSRAGFEQLLDHLAETDGSRRGAPPASLSFVNNLPCVIVSDEHEKSDGLACAICKDVLPVGAEVNQLPCLHVYHPSCILPWLSAQNSCPLCRYELPTDDKDYEQGKQNMNSRMRMHESQQQNASEDSSSENSDEADADEASEFGPHQSHDVPHVDPTINSSSREIGRDWLFRAAAPVAGIIGVVLILWLGKPLIGRRGSIPSWGQHQIQVANASSLNQRGSRGRRWWSLF